MYGLSHELSQKAVTIENLQLRVKEAENAVAKASSAQPNRRFIERIEERLDVGVGPTAALQLGRGLPSPFILEVTLPPGRRPDELFEELAAGGELLALWRHADLLLLSPRTANYQSRFEVGVNEVLLDTFPCALHYMGGLRAGVLYVSTGHLCFETSTHAAAESEGPRRSGGAVVPKTTYHGSDAAAALASGALAARDNW